MFILRSELKVKTHTHTHTQKTTTTKRQKQINNKHTKSINQLII